MNPPVHRRLPDGRLHLQHGPIDCIVEASGARAEVEAAYRQAVMRFEDVLDLLVAELRVLRHPLGKERPRVNGPVASRMVDAVWPYRDRYITPMAAVAGAVADELLQALLRDRTLEKAYVNDGGDIALHLVGESRFDVGLVVDPDLASLAGDLRIEASGPVRGVATSGWRGRSQSLGIADSATVLARSAAAADAAATMIANAVDVEHPAIGRRPAREVKEDSDLGTLPVTVEVGELPDDAIESALASGERVALQLRDRALIEGAVLSLKGRFRTVPLRAAPGGLRG